MEGRLSRRRAIILAVVGIGAALIGLLVLSGILQQAVLPRAAPTPVPPRTEPVVVAARDVPLRALLGPGDLREVEVPVELVPLRALDEIAAAAGRITKVPLIAGEMVLEHHLADPTNITHDLAFVIEDEQVLMAFPATDLMSQINILQPGDVVDILVSIEEPVLPGQAGPTGLGGQEGEPDEVLFTFDAIQRIEIAAVVVEITPARGTTSASGSRTLPTSAEATPQPTPTPEPSEVEAQAILLAISPQDALVLKHLKDAGGIVDIVLRAPTSSRLFELDPVMSEYLKDRYELVITR